MKEEEDMECKFVSLHAFGYFEAFYYSMEAINEIRFEKCSICGDTRLLLHNWHCCHCIFENKKLLNEFHKTFRDS